MSDHSTLKDALVDRLTNGLDHPTALQAADELIRCTSDPKTVWAAVELLDELHELSPKLLDRAVVAFPELRRHGLFSIATAWLDLGVALTESSGAAAMKYFHESPTLLAAIQPASGRDTILSLALEIAESEPQAALDFLRSAPEIARTVPLSDLRPWIDAGLELTRCNYVLGIEYFRQIPKAAAVLAPNQVRSWIEFGTKLMTRNSLGKPDYLGTLEFFRCSPRLLGEIHAIAARQGAIELGSVIAARDPAQAVSFLAEIPSLIEAVPEARQRLVLTYGCWVAERDPAAALAYMRRCPQILSRFGDAPDALDQFERWFKGGMEVLEYSPEGARAYFALETKRALEAVEQTASGAALRDVMRSLTLFAQGLCGTEITITALPRSEVESDARPMRPRVGEDGRTIALPAVLRCYPTREENRRLYTVMTAHEAGHLEFGTYAVRFEQLSDLIEEVSARYGRRHDHAARSLADLFVRYPQPRLIGDLWAVLEDARVEYRLRQEYPGLRPDLAVFARDSAAVRSLAHGMSFKEMAVDYLLRLTTSEPGTVRPPESMAECLERLWGLTQTILTPMSTAVDVIRLADRLYVLLEEMAASATGTQDISAEPQDSGSIASEALSQLYRPVVNWTYRGDMAPELVRRQDGLDSDESMSAGLSTSEDRSALLHFTSDDREDNSDREPSRPDLVDRGSMPEAGPDRAAKRSEAVRGSPSGSPSAQSVNESVFLYDEWDGTIRDYRTRWCRVVERVLPEGTDEWASAMLATQAASARLLRRYFESLRPPGFRRVHGQADGEDLDLDAMIGRVIDRVAGIEASERVYVRREKKERDVAAAFLVDLSGSTSRRIGPEGRRIIDVETEGLLLLSAALDGIGDRYAMYGFSGHGRGKIEFVILKDFDEPAARSLRRMGHLAPSQQNRDGAAVRHAARKLAATGARVRLLVLISDGKPLDDGYADEYALEDTKMALREARMQGIDPFCITVDREADPYLRRMYGDVRFLVIDRADALPQRLPPVYHRLTA